MAQGPVYFVIISIHTTTQVVTGEVSGGDMGADISIHTTTQVVTLLHQQLLLSS